MDRDSVAKLWKEAWESGLWAAPWGKAAEGLTAQQAAFRPRIGDRAHNSIWQIAHHITFWRNEVVGRFEKAKPTPKDEIARRNFEAPAEITEAAWNAARERLLAAQRRVERAAMETTADPHELAQLLSHDSYHFGQIMYIRALQGLPSIE